MLLDPATPPQLKRRHRSGRSPWMQLLASVLELAGTQAGLLRHAERPWASATFTGSRHTLALVFAGDGAEEAAEQFIEAVGEHEFVIHGQLVADASIVAVDQVVLPEPRICVELELLLLDDC